MHRDTVARRRTWRSSAALMVVLALALLAAACGGDDSDDTSGTGGTTAPGATTAPGETPADVDAGGILRYGQDLMASGGVKLDPTQMNTPTEHWMLRLIYDSLLRPTADGGFEPGLAKEATIVDPSTIHLVLQEGVSFQDGTPFNAEAVKFSIERNAAANKVQTFRMAELGQIESIDVENELELTIRLKLPIAGSFYPLLADGETIVVSPTAAQSGQDLHEEPVGAGPFRLVSYEPERLLKLEKWDGYFQADEIKLAGVEFVHTTAGTAMENALRSRAIDAGPVSSQTSAEAMEAAGFNARIESDENTIVWMSMQCAQYPVFQDLRVRQALAHAVDREALNQALYQGKGGVMSGLWPEGHKYLPEELEGAYAYDPDQARQLLQEAGQANLSLRLMHATTPVAQRFAEVVQQSMAEAGIRLELVPSANTVQDYYLDKKAELFVTTQSRMWTDKLTRNFAPGSTGNTCDPQSEEFTEAMNAVRGFEPGSDDAIPAWHEAQRLLSDDARAIWGVFGTQSLVWNDRVGNPSFTVSQLGVPHLDIRNVYVKQN